MIKVLIVVSGLVMFIPDAPEDLKGLTALLLDTRYSQITMPEHITAHLPALRQQVDVKHQGWDFMTDGTQDSAQIHFSVPTKQASPINLNAKSYFPQLDELADKSVTIKPECLNGRKECRDKVAAVARFEGSWRTRPLQRCDRRLNLPLGFGQRALRLEEVEAARSEFRRGRDHRSQAPRPGGQRQLATALALEAEIEKLEDLSLKVNGSAQKLQLSSMKVCGEWLGVAEPCVVFELEVWEVPVHSNCDVNDPKKLPDECRLDRHFSLFYDLLTEPPGEAQRWLPYVTAEAVDMICPTRRKNFFNKPAVRCPPTFCSRCQPEAMEKESGSTR